MSFLVEALYLFIPFVIVISIVIVIHELGHYWAGRYFNAAVESFSVGFGHSIFERKDKNNTRWRINWLPLGGFVSFVNEGGIIENDGQVPEKITEDEMKDDAAMPKGRPFNELSAGARNVVALAGPFANFILSIVIFAGLGMFLGDPIQRISVAAIEDQSAAAEAGIEIGDIFVSINGRDASRQGTILEEIKMSANDEVSLVMLRGTEEVDLTVIPKRVERTNFMGIKERTGMIGVALQPVVIDQNKLNPIKALGHGVGETYRTIGSSMEMLGKIITGRESIQQLSGPVGIANVAGGITKASMEMEDVSLGRRLYSVLISNINLIGFISVAIGFFNLLPLPILDGGQVVFNTYEAVTGKGFSEELLMKTKFATVLILLVLAVFITVGDIEEAGVLELFSGL